MPVSSLAKAVNIFRKSGTMIWALRLRSNNGTDKIALYWGESGIQLMPSCSRNRVALAAELTGKFGVKTGDRVALW